MPVSMLCTAVWMEEGTEKRAAQRSNCTAHDVISYHTIQIPHDFEQARQCYVPLCFIYGAGKDGRQEIVHICIIISDGMSGGRKKTVGCSEKALRLAVSDSRSCCCSRLPSCRCCTIVL